MTDTAQTSSASQEAPETTPEQQASAQPAAPKTEQTEAAAHTIDFEPSDEVFMTSGQKIEQAERSFNNDLAAKIRKQHLLNHAFTPAALLGSLLLLHNMDKLDTGKGPNRVVDHGHYISIPGNATEGQLQQAAQMAMKKGWNSINLHSSHGAEHPVAKGLAQIAPHLKPNANPMIGSYYFNSVRTIIGTHFNNVAARTENFAKHAAAAAAPQPV